MHEPACIFLIALIALSSISISAVFKDVAYHLHFLTSRYVGKITLANLC